MIYIDTLSFKILKLFKLCHEQCHVFQMTTLAAVIMFCFFNNGFPKFVDIILI